MKPHSCKNEIQLKQRSITPAIQALIGLVLIGTSTVAIAQAKPSSTTVKAPGAVLPTPSPTPTPPVRPAGSVPPAQPTSGAAAPAVKATSAANSKSTGLAGDVSQMTAQQFRALPSTATISYNGQSMTKAAFVEQRRKELRAHAKSVQTKADVRFKAAKSQFQQQQTLDLAARNAKVKAVADGYDRRLKQLAASPAYAALSKEASTIVQRYPSASPAEQAKLKQRAAELYSQLSKMEQAALTGH